MADIAKCSKPCDIKEACYRFTAPDSIHQAYGDPEWRDGECLDFYPRRAAPAERSDAEQTPVTPTLPTP